MGIDPAKLKILLIGSNLLTAEQFDSAEKASKAKELLLEEYLPQAGIIPDIHLGQIIANNLKMGFVDLKQEKIPSEVLKLLPEVVARTQNAIVFRVTDKEVLFASCDPDHFELKSMLERKTGLKVVPYYVTPSSIKEALRLYRGDLQGQIEALLERLSSSTQKDETIVNVVDTILEYANDNRASDVHIEPMEEVVVVRFRIDGILHEVVRYKKLLHDQLVLRLKIMAHLPIDEHEMAQDGRFSYKSKSSKFNIRLSILPIMHGENIVMRILAESSQRITLEELGLDPADMKKIKDASERPHGMILSVGPTGAGKTTTLYSILQIVNSPEVNISTIEDPVEYELEGVHQTQVNTKKNLTFATGLRSIVRQDPDIILVGEIRDEETASIAVNAAMTGHLLLSTLHANDAATAFPRLIDMGIEPFLVASSVNIVVAQRLVRRVCERCKASRIFTEQELQMINNDPKLMEAIKRLSSNSEIKSLRMYRGSGVEPSGDVCKACIGTGYVGRIGIFEVMNVDDELHILITQKASADAIAEKAIEKGMRPMIEDGINKVLQGSTTLEEIISNIKA